jgi:hypothetical protein
MVLGVRLTLLAGLVAACSPGAATNQAGAAPERQQARLDSARAGGLDLALMDEAGQCVLELEGTKHRLEMNAPCAFLRPAKGAAVWSHDYGAWGTVVLVGGPPAPDDAYRLDVGRTPADRCSNTGRAIILSGGKAALSDVKTSPIWFCPDSAPDEKYYYGIAHETAFAARKAIN